MRIHWSRDTDISGENNKQREIIIYIYVKGNHSKSIDCSSELITKAKAKASLEKVLECRRGLIRPG